MPPSQGTCATLDCFEDAIDVPPLYTSGPAENHFRSLTRVIKNPKLHIIIYLHVRTRAPRNNERECATQERLAITSANVRRKKHYAMLEQNVGYHASSMGQARAFCGSNHDSRYHEATIVLLSTLTLATTKPARGSSSKKWQCVRACVCVMPLS